MAKNKLSMDDCKDWKHHHGGGMATGGYGLAFIGAAVYFIQQAHTASEVLVGLLKAIVWPALVVYHLLGFLKI